MILVVDFVYIRYNDLFDLLNSKKKNHFSYRFNFWSLLIIKFVLFIKSCQKKMKKIIFLNFVDVASTWKSMWHLAINYF